MTPLSRGAQSKNRFVGYRVVACMGHAAKGATAENHGVRLPVALSLLMWFTR